MRATGERLGGFSMCRSVLSACCGYLFCGILLLVGAVFIDQGWIAESWICCFCWGAVLISALLAAFFAAGKSGQRIVGSLLAGLFFYALALITGRMIGGAIDGLRAAMMGGIVLTASAIGAVLSGLIRG